VTNSTIIITIAKLMTLTITSRGKDRFAPILGRIKGEATEARATVNMINQNLFRDGVAETELFIALDFRSFHKIKSASQQTMLTI
jgi:hypothetical protein